MGGEGPLLTGVRFSQGNTTISFWANRTGLKPLQSQHRQDVYSKATQFFLKLSCTLIADHGWQQDNEDTTSMLHLISKKFYLILPASFDSFFDFSQGDNWGRMFRCLDTKRESRLYIDEPTPLADIFYLLQTLSPGMLVIYHIGEMDGVGKEERTSALPPITWVEEHKELLQSIFRDTGRYDNLLAASADGRGRAVEMISSYDDWTTNVYARRDFRVCGRYCGYCGYCAYLH